MNRLYSYLVGALFLTSTPLLAQNAQEPWQAGVDTLSTVIKKDPKAAEELVKTYMKGNKKNTRLLYEIGQAYLDADSLATETAPNIVIAQDYVAKIQKIKREDPLSYLLDGDIKLHLNKAGEAASQYEQAVYFDPNNKEAAVKKALLLKRANPDEAIKQLLAIHQQDPTYSYVNRQLLNLYYTDKRDYKAAAPFFEQLIKSPDARESDFTRYAFSQLMSNNAAKAKEVAQSGLQKYPNSVACTRLIMYADIALKDPSAGASVDKFFSSATPEQVSLYDYYFRALYYMNNGKYAEAAADYESAFKKDNNQTQYLASAADAYQKAGEYGKAIDVYKGYVADLKAKNKPVTYAIFFKEGTLYYSRASQEGTAADVKAADLKAAGEAFDQAAQLEPNNYQSYFWHGRVGAALDPETKTFAAKPYYTKALELLQAENNLEKNKTDILECLRYLGYAAFQAKDMATCKQYFKQVLELDPTNEQAKQVLNMK